MSPLASFDLNKPTGARRGFAMEADITSPHRSQLAVAVSFDDCGMNGRAVRFNCS